MGERSFADIRREAIRITIVAYFDGLCEGNPGGIATFGCSIYRNGTRVYEGAGLAAYGPAASNNVGEYSGVLAILRWLLDNQLAAEDIEIRGDSRLVVNQLAGKWKVHGGLYYEKYSECKTLLKRFATVKFVWVPREQNREADALSRKAYRAYMATRKEQ